MLSRATENSAPSRCSPATFKNAPACAMVSGVIVLLFGFGTLTNSAALIETSCNRCASDSAERNAACASVMRRRAPCSSLCCVSHF